MRVVITRARELYDHNTDPDENHNLAMGQRYMYVQVVVALSKQLREGWRGAMVDDKYSGGGH